MSKVIIENIVASAELAGSLDIEKISKKIPDFMYNPGEFPGLTVKFKGKRIAALLLPNGRVIFTGAKTKKEVDDALEKITTQLSDNKIKIKKNPKLVIKNINASVDLKKELNLNTISKRLITKKVDYEPKQFPGLIYRIDELAAVILIFSSGKIVCTGTSSIDEAAKAIEQTKEKLNSLGVL